MGRKSRNEYLIRKYAMPSAQEASVRSLCEEGWNIEFRVGNPDEAGNIADVVYLSRGLNDERKACCVCANGEVSFDEDDASD
jgi:hypothetical protein